MQQATLCRQLLRHGGERLLHLLLHLPRQRRGHRICNCLLHEPRHHGHHHACKLLLHELLHPPAQLCCRDGRGRMLHLLPRLLPYQAGCVRVLGNASEQQCVALLPPLADEPVS